MRRRVDLEHSAEVSEDDRLAVVMFGPKYARAHSLEAVAAKKRRSREISYTRSCVVDFIMMNTIFTVNQVC